MGMKEDLRDLLSALVRFQSLAQREDELDGVIAFAEEYLDSPNLIKHHYKVSGKPSVIYTFEETKRPKVIFAGHLDVVDAEPEQFEPRLDGDKLWGRGALDMKGSCAVLLHLFKNLAATGRKYPVGLMLTTDEEIGSAYGVKHLVLNEGWSADFAVIPDGGEGFEMIIEEKGAVHAKYRATGKAAHGSRTWEGDNALDKLIAVYNDLRAKFPKEPCGDPEHWHNTLNIGKISGGKKVNIVADDGVMELDIRFVAPYNVEKMLHEIRAVTDRYGVTLETESTGEVMYTPPDNPHIAGFRKTVKEVIGREPKLAKEHGATDGRFFAEKGVPVVIIYPQGAGLHTREEWVDLPSLVTLYRIFVNYVNRFSAS